MTAVVMYQERDSHTGEHNTGMPKTPAGLISCFMNWYYNIVNISHQDTKKKMEKK